MPSLLDKAINTPSGAKNKRNRGSATPEYLELLLAYSRNEINMAQAANALGLGKNTVIARLGNIAFQCLNAGMLVPAKEKKK